MTAYINKFLLEGLDQIGKSSLIQGILNKRGHHQVTHFTKPVKLDFHQTAREYQERSFRNMFSVLQDAHYAHVIYDRSHLGEYVFAPLYRNYGGDYVFDLEQQYKMNTNYYTRLILLVEDLKMSSHFVDDGLSLGPTSNRLHEQALFEEAFERSIIPDKRKICVTDPKTGAFRSKADILEEALRS